MAEQFHQITQYFTEHMIQKNNFLFNEKCKYECIHGSKYASMQQKLFLVLKAILCVSNMFQYFQAQLQVQLELKLALILLEVFMKFKLEFTTSPDDGLWW